MNNNCDNYIDRSDSIGYVYCKNDELILKTIAEHFIGNNMERPYQYKVDFTDRIKMDFNGQYLFDFEQYFKDVTLGYKCSAYGKVYYYDNEITTYKIVCKGPTSCYVNDELVFKSDPDDEGERRIVLMKVQMKKGFNTIKFTTEKTILGFGFTFGQTLPQWIPYLFKPVPRENEGQLGFRYTAPFDSKSSVNLENYKFPIVDNNFVESDIPNPKGAFNCDFKGFVYAKAVISVIEDTNIEVKCNSTNRIFIDGNEFKNIDVLNLKKGDYTVVIEYDKNYNIEFVSKDIEINSVIDVCGYNAKWLYLGVLTNKIENQKDLLSTKKIYTDTKKQYYWKPLPENMILRPTVESELYGRFTYPMGVTLYGLLKCGDFLDVNRYKDYVLNDVKQISEIHEYALFDKERCGFPSINQQISWLKELDDCGSFGSLMLECLKYENIEDVKPLVDEIANFMMNVQRREDDGAYSRVTENMWIDDMYMSVPFLSRYYELTGEEKYINMAVEQMLLFKKYFYIEKTKLMSHIYDTNWKKANGIPWSRGNGWVIFSMSELLRVLPKDNYRRNDIINFFNEMAEGLLNVQGKSGLWHQVLDNSDTYLESSSTAMFICAFSRSIQQNYCKEDKRKNLLDSVNRAWNGLIYNALDSEGNLYGVCRGSGCSFSREYYKNLGWRYNDAHGIGIVLFAGVERYKLINNL